MLVCSDPGGSQAVLLLHAPLLKKGFTVQVIARGAGRRYAARSGIRTCGDPSAYHDRRTIRCFIRRSAPDFVITGTSLMDNLERDYISAALGLGIPVLSVVDWWTNYRQRFVHTLTGRLSLPGYICVPDERAARDCKDQLRGARAKVIVTGNPYFSHTAGMAQKGFSRKKFLEALSLDPAFPTVLFLAEPKSPYHDQFDIFRRVSLSLAEVLAARRKNLNLIVKFHPNGEETDIYSRYQSIAGETLGSSCKTRFVINKDNVLELIDAADFVWGMNTTPLLIAMLRGKPVSSFLPVRHAGGIPFLGRDNFCPSVGSYNDVGPLVRRLLCDKEFLRKKLKRQREYKAPGEDFFEKVYSIIDSQAMRKETP